VTIGISLVGCWYTAVLEYLDVELALKPNLRNGKVVGEPWYVLEERGLELLEDM
jgi:hypothetical protein